MIRFQPKGDGVKGVRGCGKGQGWEGHKRWEGMVQERVWKWKEKENAWKQKFIDLQCITGN